MSLEDTEAQTVEDAPIERDYEAEARQHGWKPLEEFNGDPSKHIDAEAFVKRADEVMPLLKKQNQGLKREIDELKRMVKKVVKSEQAAYQNALADLTAKQEAAVEDGDIEAFRRLNKQADQIRADMNQEVAAHDEDPAEQFDAFRDANEWFDLGGLPGATETERKARAYADRVADRMANQGLQNTLSPSEFFARIAEETKAKFPALGLKTRPKAAADAVAGTTRPAGGQRAKTGANLPADAKAQATRFYNNGTIKAKTLSEALDVYAKSYDWS